MSERIIRVFPRRTAMTPTDSMAFVGFPPMDMPDADVVHVSVAFTWNIEDMIIKRGKKKIFIAGGRTLAQAWGQYYPVEIGGPAFGSRTYSFEPGRYVKHGVTFTSRGCNRGCEFCLVKQREGRIRLLDPIVPGHIIQDNNLLQTGREHMAKVFDMLRTQRRAAIFSGGLDARLMDDWIAEQFKTLRIKQAFFACDTDAGLIPLARARDLLPFLSREKLYCYVLLGFEGESLARGLRRLKQVWDIGMMPFAQLYQPPDKWIEYPQDWRDAARTWSRPATMKAAMKGRCHE